MSDAAHRLIETVSILGYPDTWPDLVPVEPPGPRSREAADGFAARIVARGRIVRRLRENEGGRLATHLFLVEHPDLPPGEVYALFEGPNSISAYRCRPDDAIRVLRSGSAFNWT
jgi:hypothetical protein